MAVRNDETKGELTQIESHALMNAPYCRKNYPNMLECLGAPGSGSLACQIEHMVK